MHNIRELVEKNPVLRNLSNEETHEDVEMPEIVKEIASAAGLWEALELNLDSSIPSELSILDYVYNKQHLMELSTAARFNEAHEGKSKLYGHDPFTTTEKESIQQMAFQASIGIRRKEFAKQFIYESMVLRLMNDEYAKLRGDGNPRELFLNNSASYNRADKQFTQRTPLACTMMNQAEVECSLMDQMYRYRAQYFYEIHNRSFVPQFRSKMSPDEMIIMNMDVTKTVYNMVESVATSRKYVSYADETRNLFNRSYPQGSDPGNSTVLSSKEANKNLKNNHERRENQEFVILRTRNETNEIENLKHRLHKHLHENFKELIALHDHIYGIRQRAIHYHREDFQQHRRSVFRLLSENPGRRCASTEPPPIRTEKLPLYRKRRCRSVDLKIRNRVVTEVGMCYINNTVEMKSGSQDNRMPVSNTEQMTRNSDVTVGPKAYHEQWEEDGFTDLSSRFAMLINERQQLIAAITKLTLSDMDQQQLLNCAREVDVAVNTPDYEIHTTPGRRRQLKSQILLSHEARKNPALFCRLSQEKYDDSIKIASGITANDLESWRKRLGEKNLNKFTPFNSENAPVEYVQDVEWNEGVVEDTAFTKRALKMFGQRYKDSTTRFPHTQTIHEKEQQHMIEQLTDRAFHDELLFRHLLTASIKLYSFLDPIVHDEFVEKLKKLEAPRLDKLMRMRGDFTIGYLFGLPQYETTSEIPKKNHGQDNVRIAPGPEVFDEMFGGKDRNPYRDGLLFPVTTPQSTIESAQLIKYRNRETDSTPAELLGQQLNLNICAKALMRLIYTYPDSYAEELAHFTNHPAFHVFNAEKEDDNGFPCSVYQSSIQKAVQRKKPSVSEREMPEFQNDSDAETYFTNRSRMTKERIASLLTVAHKRKSLNRRCFKTMEKLSGVMEKQKSELRTVRQHYNSLSSRGKKMFLKRYRVSRYNQATRFDPEVPIEDNLNAPLPVPGFNPPDMHQGAENWIDLPDFVRNEILSQPKPPPVVVEESRSSTRGGRGGTRGRGGNRGGRRRGGRC
ncbi:hypothetical protein M3Y98_00270700 [Aphelenchoides besseyi]|nr:hypothetical protein M3Y98_00270700 [Aphelenchoides besseyi]